MRSTLLLWPILALASLVCSGRDLRTGQYAGREVIFENVDGIAMFQGDIILGTTGDIEQAPVVHTKAGNESTTVSSSRRLWPDGVAPYVIDTALSARQKQVVQQAVDHWNARTPIRLIQRGSESNYIRFTTGTSTIACSSSVGMVGGAQLIRLPEGCGVGPTIHEIGHAVGLWHEQSRNDRNRFVTLLYENIDKASGLQFEQTLDSGIDAGPYDFGSIMHYGPFDFSRDGLSPAIETAPAGIPVGQTNGLSAGDIDAIRRLYGAPTSKTTIATTPGGLKVRVDGALVDDGASFDWPPGTRHTLEAPFQGSDQTRYLFGSWSDGGDVAHTITAAANRTAYTANFIRQHRVQVSYNVPGAGSVTLDPPSPDGFYTERSSLFISATPAAGYNFLEWSVKPSRSLNPKAITIFGPTSILTSFTRSALTTLTSNPLGRIVRVDGVQYSTPVSFAWAAGERHGVSVDTPADDFMRFRFAGWSDGGDGARTISASDHATTYTANFVQQFMLTTQAIGGRSTTISTSPQGDGGYYDEGSTVELRASPPSGAVLHGWTGDARGTSNPVTLRMDEPKLVTAVYASRLPAIYVIGAATGVEGAVAPGQIVSVYGRNIGPSNAVGLQIAGGRVTTQLGGTELLFDGVPAPLTYVSADQINAVAPSALQTRSVTSVQVRYNGQTTSPVSLNVADTAPGIFTADSSGRGGGAILNENGTLNSPSNPARRGAIIALYVTGGGSTNPAVPDGQISSSVYPKPVLPVSVRIAGQPAVVHYAGAAPGFIAGLMQINVQVPMGVQFGPETPISVVIGDQSSPPGVTVALQ